MGWRIGFVSAALYVGIGAVGLPVFSGVRGGVEALIGPTGGFIWGFLLLALFCGLGANKKPLPALALGLAGLVLCNALGFVQFAILNGGGAEAFAVTTVPYVIKDAILLWVALTLAPSISRAVLRKR